LVRLLEGVVKAGGVRSDVERKLITEEICLKMLFGHFEIPVWRSEADGQLSV
jgi:hypothetical protein